MPNLMIAVCLSLMAEPSPDALVFGAPLTHSDWMLHDGVEWGPAGVRHMLDMCKASGWSQVYWRALDGGRALYKSDLFDPEGKWDQDNFWRPALPEDRALTEKFTSGMSEEARAALLAKIERYDYGSFDTLAEVVRYGHEIGLEVWAWLSINEDDHGWGVQSRFTKAHPESRWRKRDGTPYRSQQSFAFPEVRDYKLALVAEILDRYPVDGFFLDWIRTGDIRDNPQTDPDGVADWGYEPPLIDGFKEKFGIDPRDIPNGDDRWVRFRAEPQTEFMRRVRALVAAKRPGLPISAMVAHPWCYRGMNNKIDGNLRGLLLDVGTWARDGLIDAAVAAGYYLEGGMPESAYRALQDETERRVDVWLYAWVPNTVEEVDRECARAQSLGARHVLFWEADYIDGRPEKEALQRAMSDHARFPAKASP